jgi:hypothetical protein
MREIFAGRIPSTLNPPKIACEQLERLVQLATGLTLREKWGTPKNALVQED